MKSLMLWISGHPLISPLLAVLFCALFAWKAPQIDFDTSSSGLIIENSPDTVFYRKTLDTFGDDSTLSIIIKSADVFQQDILQSVEDLTYKAQELDGITRVISLATVNNLKGTKDGYLRADSLLAEVPSSPLELSRIKKNALENELLLGEVINSNGTATAIQLSVKGDNKERTFNKSLVDRVELLMEEQRSRLGPDATIYQAGAPLAKATIFSAIGADLLLLTPLSILTVLIVLAVYFRSLLSPLLPMITGTLSVATCVGFMAIMNIPLNPITLIVPSLVIIIGSTEDIHIISEYSIGLRNNLSRQAAIRRMAIRSGVAIFLTTLTTLAGFIMLSPSKVPMLSDFGIASSFGIAANFLITILVAPSLLSVLPIPKSYPQEESSWLKRISGRVICRATQKRKSVLAFLVLFSITLIAGSTKVEVDTNYLMFFRDDAPIRQAYRDISNDMSGPSVFFVTVDTGVHDGLKNPRHLSEIAKLTDFLKDKYETVISYDRFIRKTNKEMNNGDPEYFIVPDSSDLIAQYTLLMNPETLNRFADFDFQVANIVVRSKIAGSREFESHLPAIRNFVDENLSADLNTRITGETILIHQTSDTISREIVNSLFIMAISIFILISFLFRSFKIGLIAMIPNLLPVIGIFGAMGYLGISLSTSTLPVAVIALGIAVDDTIHFMVRYFHEISKKSENLDAIVNTIRHEIRPVTCTSSALFLGFSVLMFAEFGSVNQFGLLAGLAMLVALIGDLLITPALLYVTGKSGITPDLRFISHGA